MLRSVLVVGLGTFGSETAIALYRSGAQVLAVDRDTKPLERVTDFVMRAACLDVSNEEAMLEAGAFEVDAAIIALRQHFAASVLAVHMLKKHGVKDIWVYVKSSLEAEAIIAVGATGIVLPERDTAQRLARKVMTPDLADEIPLSGDVAIIEIECPAAFVGKALNELDVRKKYGVTVVAIRSKTRRKDDSPDIRVAPAPDTQIKLGDVLYVISEEESLEAFRRKVGEIK